MSLLTQKLPFVLALILPAALAGSAPLWSGEAAPKDSSEATVATPLLDMEIPLQLVDQLAGRFAVSPRGSQEVAMHMTLFGREGQLFGRIDANDPTRMLYQGGMVFHPADAPVFRLTFTVGESGVDAVMIESPDGLLDGRRVEPAAEETEQATLFATLAELDRRLFQAVFVDCDTSARNALFTEDIEMYHDKSGFKAAAKVRAPITECPADRGMTRELVDGSLEVYPLAGYGALQVGLHRFREASENGATVARFSHLWRREEDGAWRIARVISYDHQRMSSADAATAEP